ncbi:TetR/AcrR family transcriptional regulator [bacterium]|nr:TetR/AcrR family transcriptional regulator [bacterium]
MGRRSIRDQRRKEILEALYRCLLKKPFSETSIKDIGAEAGINYAMLHYYFRSKEDILIHFIEAVYDQHRAAFTEHVRDLKDRGLGHRDFARGLFGFMNTHITTDKRLQTIFVEIWEIALYNPEVNARVRKMYREWIREMAGIMASEGLEQSYANRLAMATVAFQEGMGLFSVFFNMKKKDSLVILEDFQEKILEMILMPG